MKIWKLFLVVLLCSGLSIAFGLSGCGDDDDDGDGGGGCELSGIVNRADCENGCEVLVDCGEYASISECVDECVAYSDTQKQCLCSSCDIDAGCAAFTACIDGCTS
jgi:hypothetical protein